MTQPLKDLKELYISTEQLKYGSVHCIQHRSELPPREKNWIKIHKTVDKIKKIYIETSGEREIDSKPTVGENKDETAWKVTTIKDVSYNYRHSQS